MVGGRRATRGRKGRASRDGGQAGLQARAACRMLMTTTAWSTSAEHPKLADTLAQSVELSGRLDVLLRQRCVAKVESRRLLDEEVARGAKAVHFPFQLVALRNQILDLVSVRILDRLESSVEGLHEVRTRCRYRGTGTTSTNEEESIKCLEKNASTDQHSLCVPDRLHSSKLSSLSRSQLDLGFER